MSTAASIRAYLVLLILSSTSTLAAECLQPRSGDHNTGESLAIDLLGTKNETLNKACSGKFSPSSPRTLLWQIGSMVYNASRSDESTSLNHCRAGFLDIIFQCVASGNFWGGQWSYGQETYSIRKEDNQTDTSIVNGGGSRASGSSTSTSSKEAKSTAADAPKASLPAKHSTTTSSLLAPFKPTNPISSKNSTTQSLAAGSSFLGIPVAGSRTSGSSTGKSPPAQSPTYGSSTSRSSTSRSSTSRSSTSRSSTSGSSSSKSQSTQSSTSGSSTDKSTPTQPPTSGSSTSGSSSSRSQSTQSTMAGMPIGFPGIVPKPGQPATSSGGSDKSASSSQPSPPVSDIFGDPAQKSTVLAVSGTTATYTKETLPAFANLQTPTTLAPGTTATASDGRPLPIVVPLIVGPHGVIWAPPAVGPPCLGPLCASPPGAKPAAPIAADPTSKATSSPIDKSTSTQESKITSGPSKTSSWSTSTTTASVCTWEPLPEEIDGEEGDPSRTDHSSGGPSSTQPPTNSTHPPTSSSQPPPTSATSATSTQPPPPPPPESPASSTPAPAGSAGVGDLTPCAPPPAFSAQPLYEFLGSHMNSVIDSSKVVSSGVLTSDPNVHWWIIFSDNNAVLAISSKSSSLPSGITYAKLKGLVDSMQAKVCKYISIGQSPFSSSDGAYDVCIAPHGVDCKGGLTT